jgi:predicted short-subunit dehydrogenase-like oxidoreductase (DUF2520 family)
VTFTIAGTGNIAWFLAQRLTAAGHHCAGIYGRTEKHAKELAASINSVAIHDFSKITDSMADVCFLAVADNVIPELANQCSFKETVLIHTAGAVNTDILQDAAEHYGVLWPVYSIVKNNLPNHRNIPCAWDAVTDKARRYLLSIAHGFTDVLFEAKDSQRRWLHLSAVISNNFSNHLLAICEQISVENNIPYSVLQPIIEQTFERLKKESPRKLQTGPAIRGDEQTIQKHEQMLAAHPFWQEVYSSISASIENMYRTDNER